MFFVYAIYNKDSDRIYIGQTDNVAKRLECHNNKTFAYSFTARFKGEWKLIYSENADTRSKALQREKQLKSFRGRQFLRGLILN